MTAQNYSVALELSTRQIIVTADEGESVKYPYPHRTISEMDAEAAVKRFHAKRQAKTADFFFSLTPPEQRTQERLDHARDFIQRDMPLGQITINPTA